MRQKVCRLWCFVCFLILGGSVTRGATLLSEPFTGSEWVEITNHGWVSGGPNQTDKFYYSTWTLDSGTSALANMSLSDWITYSKTFTTYTLGDNDVVTATIVYRCEGGVYAKFTLLGDKNYTISRMMADTPDSCYECSNTTNGVISTYPLSGKWSASNGAVSYYKIVATRKDVKFYIKDKTFTDWTLLGVSPTGLNTVTGLQIGGRDPSPTSPSRYVQFDTLAVEVTQTTNLLSEPFSYITSSTEITALNWVKDGANQTDRLNISSDWSLDAGQNALGNLTNSTDWLTYSKSFTTYTLSATDVVTATIAYRGGAGVYEKFALLGDKNFTVSRMMADSTDSCYECSDTTNGVISTYALSGKWYDSSDALSYFKIVATRNDVKFYIKDGTFTSWTLLGVSRVGVNTVSGVQIGGKVPSGAATNHIQFDTVNVEVTQTSDSALLSEPFEGINSLDITALGWVKDGANQTDRLNISSDWSLDAGQNALGNLTTSVEWLTYSKAMASHTLSDYDVVTATVAYRGGGGVYEKFSLLGDKNYTVSRMMADDSASCYECSDTTNGVVKTFSLHGRWYTSSDALSYLKIVATRNNVKFYVKDKTFTDWTLLGISHTGMNTVTGVQIGGKVPSGAETNHVQFDTVVVTLDQQIPDPPVFSQAGPYISGPTDVTISCATEGASIYYTLNGDTPTATSEELYTTNSTIITVNDGDLLQAIAVVDGCSPSYSGMTYIVKSMPIVAWYAIPPSATSLSRYQELRECGFTHALYFDYSMVGEALDALDAARAGGIRMILGHVDEDATYFAEVPEINTHPALEAYFIKDEPDSSEFSSLATKIQEVQAIDSDHWCYINLFANYADLRMTYADYVDSYLDTVPVDVLSFDHYPITNDGIRDGFYQNLEIISAAAKTKGVPFWAFALSVAHNPYPTPTIEHLRFQMFSNLAYGAQGVEYFTYWNPGLYPTSPIYDGTPTDTWAIVQEMNTEIKGLSPVFLGATVKSVGHTVNSDDLNSTIPDGTADYEDKAPITSLTTSGSDGAVVSRMLNGHTWYLAVVNRDIVNTMTLNMTVDASRGISTVSKTGTVTALGSGTVSYTVNPADIIVFKWAAIPGDLAAYYNTASGATWAMGDFDGDKDVDVADLSLLAANYNYGSASTVSWAEAYAQAFGTTNDADETTDASADDSEDTTSSVCSSLGLSLIAGLAMLGLMIVKLEE
jgi:hypothetical protein